MTLNTINRPNLVGRKARIPVTMGDRVIGEVTRFDPAVLLEGREIQKIYEIGSKKYHFLKGKMDNAATIKMTSTKPLDKARGVSIQTIAPDELAYVAEIPADVPNENGDVITEEALKKAVKEFSDQPMRPATLLLSESSALDLASMMIREREGAAADDVDRRILNTINRV